MKLAALAVGRGEASLGGPSPLLDAAERCLDVAESSADQVQGLLLVRRRTAATPLASAVELGTELGMGGQTLSLTLHAGAEGLVQSLIVSASLLESTSLDRVLVLIEEGMQEAGAVLLESGGPGLAAQSFGQPGESGVGEQDPARRLVPLTRRLLAAAGWMASDVDVLLTEPRAAAWKDMSGLARADSPGGEGSLLRRVCESPTADRLALPARALFMGWAPGRAFAGVAMNLSGVKVAPSERWALEPSR